MCLYFLERQNSDSVDCNKMEIDLVTAQILGLKMGVCTSNNLIATVSMADVVCLACRNCECMSNDESVWHDGVSVTQLCCELMLLLNIGGIACRRLWSEQC